MYKYQKADSGSSRPCLNTQKPVLFENWIVAYSSLWLSGHFLWTYLINKRRDKKSCKHSKHAWGTDRRKCGINFYFNIETRLITRLISLGWDCLSKLLLLRLPHWSFLNETATLWMHYWDCLTQASLLISPSFLMPLRSRFPANFEEPIKILKLCLRKPVAKFSCQPP
jgi:hypothetical protein